MSGSKAGAARARSGKGRGNAGAATAPAARQAAAAPAREATSPAREATSPAADAGPREGEYVVSLPTFEGPLDLLLHLIQQHELDILDIPVSFVTEKYLEYLKIMRSLSIDLASEYLVMAATLTHIKSKMLLPSVPAGQDDDGMPGEEEDPRAELVRRLLEYQKYKVAASELADRGTLGRDVFTRGMSESEVPKGPAPFAPTAIFSLLDAFERVLKRTNVQIDHEVVFDRISITDRIVELTEKLSVRRAMRFEDLLLDSVSKGGAIPRFEVVITFLAVLEMCKLRLIRVHQTDPLAPIHIELAASDGEPPPAFDVEDGALAAERFDSPGSDETGAPPAPGERGATEGAEVGSGEAARPDLADFVEVAEGSSDDVASAEPAEPVETAVSGEPAEPELAEAAEGSSDDVASAEPAEPVETAVSGESAEPELAEVAEGSSDDVASAEPVEPVETAVSGESAEPELAGVAEGSSDDVASAEPVEPVETAVSGESAEPELAEGSSSEPPPDVSEPAETRSGEPVASELESAEEAARASDAAPAELATEADAGPPLEEAARDTVASSSDVSASADVTSPLPEVDGVDAGSGRDGG